MVSHAVSTLKKLSQKGLGRNSLLAVCQILFNTIAIFASFRILIDYHGIGAVGLWSVTMGLISFVRLADLTGGSSLSRFVAIVEPKNRHTYIDTVLIFTLVLYGALCLLIWVPVTYIIGQLVDPVFFIQSQVLIPYAIVAFFILIASGSQFSAIDGLHRADIRSIISILGFVMFLIFAFLWIPKQGVIGMAKAQIIQYGFYLTASRFYLYKKIPALRLFPIHWSILILKKTLGYGFKLQLNSMSIMLFDPITKLIITNFSGLEILGIYEIANKIVTHLKALVLSAFVPMIPNFAKDYSVNPDKSYQTLSKSQFYLNHFNLFFMFIALTIGPIMSLVILSNVSILFLIFIFTLTIAYCINIFGIPSYFFAQAIGRLKWNIIGQLLIVTFSVIFTILFFYLLPSNLSPLGISVGLSIGSFIMAFKNIKMTGIDSSKFLPEKKLLIVSLCIIMLYGFAYHIISKYYG